MEIEEDNKYIAVYVTGYVISCFLIFTGAWIWSWFSYGFFIGVAFGWIPAGIFAAFLSLFWPLLLIAAAIFFLLLSRY